MQRASRSNLRRFCRENRGVVFILPWLFGFLVFKGYPFIYSLLTSFSDLNLFRGSTQIGIMNYVEIFTTKKIMQSYIVTIKYVLLTVPAKLIFALFIAYLLNFRMKGIKIFRTAYYIPSILGTSVAISILWRAIYKDDGIINMFLQSFGLQGFSWLSDKNGALIVISSLRVWEFGSSMVIFLAALKGIPLDLYEAADIDGATKRRQFFSITLPQITPIIYYNLVTSLVQAFQEFNGPYIVTNGGPRSATTLTSILIYNNAFKKYDIGMASAEAWVLFLMLMLLTLILNRSQKYWVFYPDD